MSQFVYKEEVSNGFQRTLSAWREKPALSLTHVGATRETLCLVGEWLLFTHLFLPPGSPWAGCQPGDGTALLEAHWLQKHRVWGLWIHRGSCYRSFYPDVLI